MGDKVLTGVQAVELGNVARDCENAGERACAIIMIGMGRLIKLGLIPDEKIRLFERYYREGALVDAAKLMEPPHFYVEVIEREKGWLVGMAYHDEDGWEVSSSMCEAEAKTEHHARAAAALKAWGKAEA